MMSVQNKLAKAICLTLCQCLFTGVGGLSAAIAADTNLVNGTQYGADSAAANNQQINVDSARANYHQNDASTFAASENYTDAINLGTDEDLPEVKPTRTFSLKSSFDLALKNNREAIASQYNIPIARAGVISAGAILNPRFSFMYGFGPAFRYILAGNPQQFGWQQEIQTAGKRTKQINLAKANLTLAELQYQASLFGVYNRVRRSYAEQAAAEAYVELVQAQKKVAMELLNVAQKRYEAGKAARSEVFQAELGVLQYSTQINQANLRLQQASAALGLLVGETPQHLEVIDVDDNGIFRLSTTSTDLVPPPAKPMPNLDVILALPFDQRPDLKVAVQQAFADRRALTLARSRRIPDVFLDSGYQFTTMAKHQPYNLFNGNVPNSPGNYLNVNAELPVFYQHQGETDQAKATWLQDYDQIEQLKSQITKDTVVAFESICVARANILKFQKELLPAAAQVARLGRLSYQSGKSDLGSAILAKQQYQQVLSSYFNSVVDYQNSWADLEKAVGAPLQL